MTNVTSLYGLKIVAYGGQAAISFIDGVTGEVAKVKLADGYHDLTNYQPLLGAFDCVIENAIVNNTASGLHRIVDQRSDDFGNTAAVSTYTPSEAVRFQRAVEDIAHRVALDMAAKAAKRQRHADVAVADEPALQPQESAEVVSESVAPPAAEAGAESVARRASE